MKLVIFSGTSDGNKLCQWLSKQNITADVYVATEYGEQVMPKMEGINIHIGRLNTFQMAEIIDNNTCVIDCTHPYASEVTINIKTVCEQKNAKYLRFLRESLFYDENIISVKNTQDAVNWLSNTSGNILLTTGSKELEFYTKIPNYQERLFVRVLPTASVLQKCESLGFKGSHIIAMQGPFSQEMNVAMLKQINAEILVTKDSGKSGGFIEKQQAAKQANVKMLMIERPLSENGLTLEQIKDEILKLKEYPRFPLFISLVNKNVLIVGAGKIAKRRFEVLKRFGANVTVIAIENRADIENVIIKSYSENDLNDMALVIAATDDRATNHKIYLDCNKKNILVSVADCFEESSFFFPAICQNDILTAGLVSNGKNHTAVSAMAREIRNLLGVNE